MLKQDNTKLRVKAFNIYQQHNGNIKIKDIANKIGVAETTVRAWKRRDNWDTAINLDTVNVEDFKGKSINQKGNTNAVGGKGGEGGPFGNKKALSTGEFERIFWDTLTEDERVMAENIPMDKYYLLGEEIKLITVRERRMLKRLEIINNEPSDTLIEGIKTQDGNDLMTYENKVNKIMMIEEALTRVQDKKLKTVEMLHKFEMETLKYELNKLKIDNIIEKANTVTEDGELIKMLEGLKNEL